MKVKKLIVLLLVVGLASASQAAVVADCRFDDIAPGAVADLTQMTDFGGAGNHGTIHGAGTAALAPGGTTAVYMGGANTTYGEIVEAWGLGQGDFTIEVIADFTTPARGSVVAIWDTSVSYWSMEQESGLNLLFQPGPGSDAGFGVGDYTLRTQPVETAITGWHTMKVVVDMGVSATLYLDGVFQESTADTWGPGSMDGILRVGLTPWASHLPFEGLVDRVTIWDVPEPMTIALLGLGGLLIRRRRR